MEGLAYRSLRFLVVMAAVAWFIGCVTLSPSVPDQDADVLSSLSGLLLMECIDSEARICALDLPAGNRVRIVTSDCKGNCLRPSLSPSGGRIVFIQGSSERADVWQVDADGHNPQPLTQDEAIQQDPVWSPDGTLIAYRILRDPYTPPGGTLQVYQRSVLYTMGPDGTGEDRLTPRDGYVLAFDWSPGGDRLVISARLEDLNQDGIISREDRARLYTVDLGSRKIRRVVADVAPRLSMHKPMWSRDGSHIAYVEGHGDLESYGDLVVVKVGDGSEVARIELSGAVAYSWSPSGEKIAYVGYSEQTSRVGYVDVFIFDLSTQDVMPLTDTSLYSVFGSYEFRGISLDDPVWSPNGRHVAFIWRWAGKDYVVVSSADSFQHSRVVGSGHYRLFAWGQ